MAGRGIQEILADAVILAREYYAATGKPLGITGEVGEAEAARLLGLTLAEARSPGYDATDVDEQKYQIKSRVVSYTGKKINSGQKLGAIRLKHSWDVVLFVAMDDFFVVQGIWSAKRANIEKALLEKGSKARNERGALSVSKFKSIGKQVWPPKP